MTNRSSGWLRPSPTRLGVISALLMATVAAASCDRPLLVAPSGSRLTLLVAATSVPVNGVLEITALLTSEDGTGVDDGSTVFFSSSLGAMDPVEVRVNNGRATTRLLSGDRSGLAVVRASSGSLQSSDVVIQVGSVPAQVTLTTGTASAGSISLIATVFDANGARLAGVPVQFTTSSGTLAFGLVTTDGGGRANNTLFGSTSAVITASVGDVSTNFVVDEDGAVVTGDSGVLTVNVAFNPSTVNRNDTVTFTAAVTAAGGSTVAIKQYQWSFSTGQTFLTTGNTISVAFPNQGHVQLTLTVEAVNGATGQTSAFIYVD